VLLPSQQSLYVLRPVLLVLEFKGYTLRHIKAAQLADAFTALTKFLPFYLSTQGSPSPFLAI